MNPIKYLIYLLLVTLSFGTWDTLYAQQDPQVSQYMFSGIYLNPAIAGTSDNIETFALYRQQWAPVASNPSTMLLNINTPIDHKRMGIGGQLYKVSYNDMQLLHFNLAGSYKINIGKSKLSMGLEIGTRNYHFSYDNLQIKDPGDKVLVNQNSKLVPDIGAGIYYYNKKKYIGISTKHLNQGKVSFSDNNPSNFNLAKHYYFTAGFEINLSKQTTIRPYCLIKYLHYTPLQADISMITYFQNAFWAGITMRSSKEAGILLGFIPNKISSSIGEEWQVGFAFDYGFNNRSINNQAGSYELLLQYRFRPRPKPESIRKRSKITSPMLFGNSPIY